MKVGDKYIKDGHVVELIEYDGHFRGSDGFLYADTSCFTRQVLSLEEGKSYIDEDGDLMTIDLERDGIFYAGPFSYSEDGRNQDTGWSDLLWEA